jgi:hypothetical protein
MSDRTSSSPNLVLLLFILTPANPTDATDAAAATNTADPART